MITNKIQPVILAGGSGTRLWPLSRKMYPKQFLALDSSANSLLQNTVNFPGLSLDLSAGSAFQ